MTRYLVWHYFAGGTPAPWLPFPADASNALEAALSASRSAKLSRTCHNFVSLKNYVTDFAVPEQVNISTMLATHEYYQPPPSRSGQCCRRCHRGTIPVRRVVTSLTYPMWACSDDLTAPKKLFCIVVSDYMNTATAAGNVNSVDLSQLTPQLRLTAQLDFMVISDERGTQRNIHRINTKYTSTAAEDDERVIVQLKRSTSDLLHTFTHTPANSSSEDCPICLLPLTDSPAVALNQCGHNLHSDCLQMYCRANKFTSFIQCPVCRNILGCRIGKCPPGIMLVDAVPRPLEGFPPNSGQIDITYFINAGYQGLEHPNVGIAYYPSGFPRRAFLPDTTEGYAVLSLLKVAWQRGLTFTVGHSLTTGCDNVVTWSEIHHKTSPISGPFGFPDPGYIAAVTAELAQQGVTEANSDELGPFAHLNTVVDRTQLC